MGSAHHIHDLFSSHYDTVEVLKRELSGTRWTIMYLMPEAIKTRLTDFTSCESRSETYAWQHQVVEGVIAIAAPLPPRYGISVSDRANCPLCGRGSSSQYEEGFSIPEGLRRHLTGWGSNIRQCGVMEAAFALARDYWQRSLRAAEEAEAAELQKRRESETLYRIDPDAEPVLIEEFLLFAKPRDEQGLAWAEQRLAELGMQNVREENIRTYIDERQDCVVYADLRRIGEIRFSVFAKTLEKGRRNRDRRRKLLASFSLLDSWKNDLGKKYERRIKEALRR